MISRLRGTVIEVTPPSMVVDVQGVGYDVLVPEPVLVLLSKAEGQVELFVRQIFREDGVTLYGFFDSYQRRIFDLLTGVTGCGPKTALAAISTLGEAGVAEAIVTQDARILVRTPGIGQKVAERLVLELKDKIQEEEFVRRLSKGLPKNAVTRTEVEDELVDALLGLGYKRQEAEAASVAAREETDVLEEQIRAALRQLKKS